MGIAVLLLPAVSTVRGVAATIGPRQLVDHVPAVVRDGQARLLGHHDPSDDIRLVVGMPLRNKAALDRFLADTGDPASGRFAGRLTQAQVNQEFDPTVDQEQRIQGWLRANGLSIDRTYPNHLMVSADGTTTQVEHMLGITLNDYSATVGGNQVHFYSADRNPTVDASVSDVVESITGLDSFPRVHHANAVTYGTATNWPPYHPQDYANAYDVDSLWNASGTCCTGAGQHIGVIFGGAAPSADTLNEWASSIGAPSQSLANGRFNNIQVGGAGQTDATSEEEAAADVEYASALAPGAVIDYYSAAAQNLAYLEEALNVAGTDTYNNSVISNSWETCEATSTNDPFTADTSNIFESNAATGHTYLFSSGDWGSRCVSNSATNTVQAYPTYPASSPYVLSVGGTTATQPATLGGEQAWGNSGGGYSNIFWRPVWQRGPGVNNQANGNPGSRRGYPDVSASDAVYGGYECYGTQPNAPSCSGRYVAGTSFSCPLWAGLLASIFQYLQTQGYPYPWFITPTLYDLQSMPNLPPGESAALRDITTGGQDTTTGWSPYYSASPGWDPVTGWGTPDGWALGQDLAKMPRPPVTASISVVPNNVDVFYVSAQPCTISGFSCAPSSPPCPANHLCHQYWVPSSNAFTGPADLGAPPGTSLVGVPSVTAWAGQRMDLAVLGQDRSVWFTSSDSNYAWVHVGGNFTSSPVIAAATNYNLVDICGIGLDGNLWCSVSTNEGATWGPWQYFGMATDSLPSVVQAGTYNNGGAVQPIMDVFARGSGNDILVSTATGTANGQQSWSSPVSLGGGFLSPPTAFAWIPTGTSTYRVDVYGIGLDRAIYHKWSTDGVNWNPSPNWAGTAGGVTSSIPGISGLPTPYLSTPYLDIVILGMDGNLWHSQTSDDATWTSWQKIGGVFTSGPSMSYGGPGPEDLFARAWNGEIAYTGGSGSTWKAPYVMGYYAAP